MIGGSASLAPVRPLHSRRLHLRATRRHRLQAGLVLALVLIALTEGRTVSAVVPILVSHGDAFVAHDNSSNRWSIGSRDLDVGLGFDAAGAFTLQSIANPVTGRSWNVTAAADAGLSVGSRREILGRNTSLAFINAQAEETNDGVRLTFTFEDRSLGILVSRVYACYPGSPTIETWTRIQATSAGASATLADLVEWQITMPAATVHTLTGLRGLSTDHEDAFVRQSRDLETGDRLDFGADARSTQDFVPLVSVDDGRDEFFGGLVWSGAWNMSVERLNDRLRVTASFPGLSPTVTVDHAVELPHGFFGVTSRAAATVSGALRQFVVMGLRHGRPFKPLVTYNTWFAYGTAINEKAMNDEIDHAAALGVELFVVDAGWYVGAGATGDSDFESGLGSWTTDTDRFPSGLAGLADHAHAVGMKFGLWVEPERVSLDTVGLPILAQEPWLVTADGSYGSQTTALVCLADAAARQWVWDELVALIEDSHLDYLKWDNNFWLNCNRGGHGHGATDGSFQHVQALYGLYEALHERYPDLMLENVASGGNRLDFGMLRYTDVAWMDDKTDPSSHVRHNLEGLTFAYSPAYLLSFVTESETEPLSGPDFRFILRSRMPGAFGLTIRTEDLSDEQTAILKEEIANYKSMRDILAQSNAMLLSDQAPVGDDSWEVLEEVADDQASALMFVFKADSEDGRLLVRPCGLRSDVDYDVRSLDGGPIGTANGDSLMTDGIEVIHAAESRSRAHVFVFQAR